MNTPLANRTTDELVQLIEDEDLSYAKIALRWDVAKTTLIDWINAPGDRSVRVKLARANAAEACDRKAEQILLDLSPQATLAEVRRAELLASHYRWQAKVRNPATHGDKVQVDQRVTVNPATISDAALLEAAMKLGVTIDGMADLVTEAMHSLPAPLDEAVKPAD